MLALKSDNSQALVACLPSFCGQKTGISSKSDFSRPSAARVMSSEASVVEATLGTPPENVIVPISKRLFCTFIKVYLFPSRWIMAASDIPEPSRYMELTGPIQLGFPPISVMDNFKVRISALGTVQTWILASAG